MKTKAAEGKMSRKRKEKGEKRQARGQGRRPSQGPFDRHVRHLQLMPNSQWQQQQYKTTTTATISTTAATTTATISTTAGRQQSGQPNNSIAKLLQCQRRLLKACHAQQSTPTPTACCCCCCFSCICGFAYLTISTAQYINYACVCCVCVCE